ncbi:sugar ABC transporter permease [Saccharospirillum sp. HFRX-1]|uniref:carbohydrate ABC transporter permease n=1 Tax=unclassified Saccharospirillum TaxID=2633430 RepID=UPI0037224B03
MSSTPVVTAPTINRSARFHESLSGWLFISPLLTGFCLFFVGPLIAIFVYSLTEWNILSQQSSFVGLENYRDILFENPEFWEVLRNSLVFAAGLVPLNVALALVLALALNRAFHGVIVFRTMFFAPVVTAGAAWAIVWTFLLQKESGGINQMLALVGIDGPNWLRQPDWAMFSVIVTRVLKNVGLNMILYLAALQTIPRDYAEAATLDGAGRWHIFRHLTWPMLAPTTLVISIVTVVGSLKVFDHIYLMTGGGPENATLVLAYYIYERAFEFFEVGYASALAVVLFVVTLGLTLAQWFMKKESN